MWLENESRTLDRIICHLKKHGFSIDVEQSISGFLRRIHSKKYRFAIIDLHITDVESGETVIDLIKRNYPYISILVFSSLTLDKTEAGVTYRRKNLSRLAPEKSNNNDILDALSDLSKDKTSRFKPNWWKSWELSSRIAPTFQTRILAIGAILYAAVLIADATSNFQLVDQALNAIARMWMTTVLGIVCLLLYYTKCPREVRGFTGFSQYYLAKKDLYSGDDVYRAQVLGSESVRPTAIDRGAPFDVLYAFYNSYQTSTRAWPAVYYTLSALYAGVFVFEFSVALAGYIGYINGN